MKILPTTFIEDLVREVPGAVAFLMQRGIKCVACGEPIWGTLEEAAREKEFSDAEIQRLIDELNQSAGAKHGNP